MEQPANEALKTNSLYFTEPFLGVVAAAMGEPLSSAAWTPDPPKLLSNGDLFLRHVLDRRNLGATARIVWAWRLSNDDANGPVVVNTATGRMRPDQDGLAGYQLSYWIAAAQIQFGKTIIRPRGGPFMFGKMPQYPGWVFAKVLDQDLHAKFQDEPLTGVALEEAFPGESPIYDFSFEIAQDGR